MSTEKKESDVVWYVPGAEGPEAKPREWVEYWTKTADDSGQTSNRVYRVYNRSTRFGFRDQIIRGHLTDVQKEYPEITVCWRVLGEVGSYTCDYVDLTRWLAYHLLNLA